MSIAQLTIWLGKSKSAIAKKLSELSGNTTSITKNKKSYIGKRTDLGISLRSAWEADTCRYFIHIGWDWMYEPKTFLFAREKRGVISYMPDFYIPSQDIYIEVKGFLDSKGRSAIRKFKRYYPEEFRKLRAITGSTNTQASDFFRKMNVPIIAYFLNLKSQYKDVIPNWESR